MIFFLPVFVWGLLTSCNHETTPTNDQTETQDTTTTMSSKKKVTGVGGIFFKCTDPKQMREWYATNLGLATNDYGASLEFRPSDEPDKKGILQWTPFDADTKYFAPSEKQFMVNYRVENMEELVKELEAAGVEVVDTIESYDYGKFVHIMDPERNKIQLWEPVDEALTGTTEATGDKKKKATGIGGIFFKCKDPKKLKEWYANNLGLVTNEYGSLFEFRLLDEPDKKGYLQWSPFGEKTDYFQPSEKEFMINYRVENIESLVEEFKASGVEVVDTIESYEYGKFVHIMDPDGNKIELWEPEDSVFTKMYEGETTK